MNDHNEMQLLSNQLCFSLYACSKEIVRLYKPYLDPYGLTYTQYIVLLALWEMDDVPVSELGRRLTLDSGTLTPLLKKLEKLQLLTRTRSSKDERSVRIRLTQNGLALRGALAELPQKMFCHTGLTPAQAVALKQSVDELLSNVLTVR